MGKRKGQFFIVGAVVIAIMLYLVWGLMSSSENVDFSDMQSNEPSWVIEDIERGLYASINCEDASEPEAIQDCMDSFIELAKREYDMKGTQIDIRYVSGSIESGLVSILVNAEISGENYYVEKDILVPFHDTCMIPYQEVTIYGCSDLDLDSWGSLPAPGNGTSTACCKAYGLCCD